MIILGIGMMVSSILILIGWILYKLWQAEEQEAFICILFIVLMIGGMILTFTGNYKLVN